MFPPFIGRFIWITKCPLKKKKKMTQGGRVNKVSFEWFESQMLAVVPQSPSPPQLHQAGRWWRTAPSLPPAG